MFGGSLVYLLRELYCTIADHRLHFIRTSSFTYLLFLLPCGFHESDSLVMFGLAFLRVWPIHLHRLWRISTSIGCWFVLRHSSWLLIISGQWIFSIFLRQVLRKVCNFFVLATVVLQVSAPYNRTGLTIELKMRSLVFVERMQTPPPAQTTS